MAKRSNPKTTYSFRLDQAALRALQVRASEHGMTVGATIRSLIGGYLEDREGEDFLAQMEARIIATIERIDRQRSRTRRVAELTLAEVDYLRRVLDVRQMKRLDQSETNIAVIRRGDEVFFSWLHKSSRRRLDNLLKADTEVPVFLETAPCTGDEPSPTDEIQHTLVE